MTEDVTPTDDDNSTPDPNSPAGLRDALERAQKQAKEEKEGRVVAETRLMEQAFKGAGLADVTKGIGKAIVMTYDGEPDIDAIKEYAKTEFDLDLGPANTVATEVIEAQDRVDGVVEASSSITPSDLDARISEAEKSGDVQTSMALKMAKVVG
jgi:hypothetical protein